MKSRQSHRSVSFLMFTLMAGIGVLPATANSAPGTEAFERERLAQTLALHPDQITDLVTTSERLVDGRIVHSVKAIDTVADRIVGASYIGERAVDLDAERHQANTLWRFAHGAKTVALVERLNGLSMDDRLTVDLWFAFEQPDDGGGGSGGLDQLIETGEADPNATPSSVVTADGRLEALPLPHSQALRVEHEAMTMATQVDPATPEAGESEADAEIDPEWWIERKAQAAMAIERVEADNQQRIATLQQVLAPVSADMRHKLESIGLHVLYASDMVPSIIVEGTRRQIEVAARWHDVALIDPVLEGAGPSLNVARSAHNAVPLNAVGHDGTGVTVAVVEGGRVFADNPFMTVAQTRLPNLAPNQVGDDNHATAVGGVIQSSHGAHRGMSSAATLISANARYNADVTENRLEAATDWAAARAQVMNHSWGSKGQDNSTFGPFDRRLDHITRYSFRLNVHAAGNHGAANCGQGNSSIVYGVESPGRGYNTLTVGGFDDRGTVGWGDDLRYRCSATGSPTGDSAGGSHQKPEIAAAAVGITSLARTTSQTSPLSGAWTGTSFAAPAISGIAANMMEANPTLAGTPVSVRALLLAGAIHNPAETRAVSATASTFAAEWGPWYFLGASSASFPRSYNVYARAGQRVRFAITWMSNVTLNSGTYSNDRLPADLDLRAYRSNGTLVASSLSANNPFEIVDFVAPVADTYEFRINVFNNAWTGGATPFAAAARIDGYLTPRGTWWSWNSPPPTMGMFYDIRPSAEYSGAANQWRGVALRPATGDYNLRLFNTSWFLGPANNTDTYNRVQRAESLYGSNQVDFILVDGNHWNSATREHYRVHRWNGSGAYTFNAANLSSLGQDSKGTYGPFSMDNNTALFVFDIGYRDRSLRRFTLIPAAGSGSADLGMAIYRSESGNNSTWARGRGSYEAMADNTGAGGTERLRYRFPGTANDRLGLAVYNKNFNTSAQFYLRVTPSSLFSDGFNGD